MKKKFAVLLAVVLLLCTLLTGCGENPAEGRSKLLEERGKITDYTAAQTIDIALEGDAAVEAGLDSLSLTLDTAVSAANKQASVGIAFGAVAGSTTVEMELTTILLAGNTMYMDMNTLMGAVGTLLYGEDLSGIFEKDYVEMDLAELSGEEGLDLWADAASSAEKNAAADLFTKLSADMEGALKKLDEKVTKTEKGFSQTLTGEDMVTFVNTVADKIAAEAEAYADLLVTLLEENPELSASFGEELAADAAALTQQIKDGMAELKVELTAEEIPAVSVTIVNEKDGSTYTDLYTVDVEGAAAVTFKQTLTAGEPAVFSVPDAMAYEEVAGLLGM